MTEVILTKICTICKIEKDINLFLTQNNKCVYCNLHLAITGYHIDHIMPLVLGGSNWINNIQLLCPQCNLKKHAKNPDIYEKEIGYIRIKL